MDILSSIFFSSFSFFFLSFSFESSLIKEEKRESVQEIGKNRREKKKRKEKKKEKIRERKFLRRNIRVCFTEFHERESHIGRIYRRLMRA